MRIFKFWRTLLFVALLPTCLSAGNSDNQESSHGHSHHQNGKKVSREQAKEFIDHHLQDSYGFHVTEGVGFSLPVILIDEGLQVFSSSKFGSHGDQTAEVNGKFYKIFHGKIYKTGADGTLTMDHGHPTNVKPLNFSITKNVFVIILMSAFLIYLFSSVAKSYNKGNLAPSGAAKFLEPIIIFVRDEIAIPNIGEKHYKRYMSFLLTTFFFIWFLNLLGMTPLGVNVTGNLSVTACLAIITYCITTFSGNKNYWGHIFWMPGVPTPMKIILAPIELLGTIIKPFALMIRLYANMTAGHVVIMSLLSLILVFNTHVATGSFLTLTLVISVLELLVAALQAYIFTMLAALYFGSAVEEAHH